MWNNMQTKLARAAATNQATMTLSTPPAFL
jgi:hypothetical protein